MQKRLSISIFIIFLTISIIIFASVFFKGGYGITSTIVVLLSMLPFYAVFENRKPKAREIVPIAVMSAVAVVGRLAFAFIPQFKPILAIIIITAMVFGAEAGFLCGTTSMLVSNFFFGQGPWTPWQMFCCGIIGFIAGILSRKGYLKGEISLAIFGIASGFFYGGVVDVWSVIGFTSEINLATAAAIYASSFWFNATLALAKAFFLYVLAPPLTEKLIRIKIKFGI